MRVIIRVHNFWLLIREKIQSSIVVEASTQIFVPHFEDQN